MLNPDDTAHWTVADLIEWLQAQPQHAQIMIGFEGTRDGFYWAELTPDPDDADKPVVTLGTC